MTTEQAYWESMASIKLAIKNARSAADIPCCNPDIHKKTARLLLGTAKTFRKLRLPR